jgi:hypothetical protein
MLRCVCAPQYEEAGTSMGPKLSVSVRVLVISVFVSIILVSTSHPRRRVILNLFQDNAPPVA